ncbi:Galectin [Fasciola gigantica]|uniref:Galectin n=1 Tax=Fasciola gigantica TaxID=46835 RepID=A0A504YB52_FASGI|nr:Galectin [Fasciola gigantica]
MAYELGDNLDGEYLDGPIKQPIPDNLIAGDFIEINGFCRGPEVIVELQTDETEALKNSGVLPLRIVLNSGGPVQVMSQNRDKVQKQEHYVKNGIQDGLAFELCIRAFDDGYDVRLNNESVCHVAHLVKLEQVGYIVMDGDADFTSIEFKDVYGEEDDVGFSQEDVQPGFMRVNELRQSSTRKKAAPILVRSSTRRSQRSNRLQSPPDAAKSHWETSTDLSRPELDIDRPSATMPSAYSNDYTSPTVSAQVRGVPNQDLMTYEAPRGGIDADFGRAKTKPILGGRKSVNLSGSNLEDQYVVGSMQSKAIAGETHRGSYMTLDDEVALRGPSQVYAPVAYGSVSGSTPNLTEKNKKKRSSWLIGKKKNGGSETDLQGSTVDLEKKKKGSIRDLFKRKKSTPSTSNVDVRQSVSMPDVTYPTPGTMVSTHQGERPIYLGAAADKCYVRGPVPSTLTKEPAANIAAYLAAQKAVPDFENFTLTPTRGMLPDQTRVTSKLAPVAAGAPRDSTFVDLDSEKDRKLKGTAPELADALLDQGRADFDHQTTLTGKIGEHVGGVTQNRVSTAPEMYAEQPIALTNAPKPKGTTLEMASSVGKAPVVIAPVGSENSQKIKGTAPEMASQLHEIYGSHALVDNYTLSGSSQLQKSKDAVYPKSVVDNVPQKTVIYQEPGIEKDYSSSRPVKDQPTYGAPIQPRQALTTEKSQPTRSMSTGYQNSDDDLSDVSARHSDHEFYLDVGRSAYYMERKKSLKRYRSRRTVKREREARRSMGLAVDRDSQHSSISSLKPGDPVLIPRKKMGTDKAGVDLWLNGHANTYGHEQRTERPRVYAAPPIIVKPPVELSLVIDANQMRKDGYKAKLPSPLKAGRTVHLRGQFLNLDGMVESCSILFSGPTGETSTQMLKVWSDASLKVYGFLNLKPVLLLQCNNSTPVVEPEFELDLHNRNNKLAITVRDTYTVFVPSGVAPNLFTFVSLESCDNAILTELSVSETLSLPLEMNYDIQSTEKEGTIQTLSLQTKLTAESKKIILTFTMKEGKVFKVIFDFVKDCALVQVPEDPVDREPARHEIPFVPEQIREISVHYQIAQTTILVRANGKRIASVCTPFDSSMDRIEKVRIEGDFLVFSAEFE